MRLNQLAKKVGKPYTRVEKYLVKECGLEGIDGPNTKVDEAVIEKVIYKFGLAEDNKEEAPKKVVLKTIEAVAAEIKPEEKGIKEADHAINAPTPAEAVKPQINLEDIQVNPTPIVSEEVASEEPVAEVVETENEEIETPIAEVVEETQVPVINEEVTTVDTGETTLHLDADGVIKAPKVELEGIKVMGKIDLPEPKVEVEEETEADAEEVTATETPEEAPKEEVKKPAKPKKKKPSADQIEARRLKRIEAQKQAEREKFELENAERLQKEKEAKKLHYQNAMKNNQPVKKKAKKSKTDVDAAKEAQDTQKFEQKHKYEGVENLSTWQKVVKWFNT